jgi:hypothetical protein
MVMPCSRSAARPVDEEREVEVAALRADLLGVGLERGELVLEDHLRVRRAAGRSSVDLPSSTLPQVMKRSRLLLLVLRAGRPRRRRPMNSDEARHQKYPSCFFFSIEADWHPCR